MDALVQSDLFLTIIGVSQIIIAVFLIFILGLAVKIFSDVSYIIGRVKEETDEVIADIGEIRREVKSTTGAVVSYLTAVVSATGVKKALGLLSGFFEQKSESKKKTRKTRSKKSQS